MFTKIESCDDEKGETKPLTAVQQKNVSNLREAYGDFWNNIKFRKNWAAPPFQRSDVEHLLARAAEIVVRVRTLLDEKDTSFKIRCMDGCAREYFWTVTRIPRGRKKEDAFVRNVVHQTFMDGRGYVEGLAEKQLDHYIALFNAHKDLHDVSEAGDLLDRMAKTAYHVSFLLETSDDASLEALSKSKVTLDGLRLVLQNVEAADRLLSEMLGEIPLSMASKRGIDDMNMSDVGSASDNPVVKEPEGDGDDAMSDDAEPCPPPGGGLEVTVEDPKNVALPESPQSPRPSNVEEPTSDTSGSDSDLEDIDASDYEDCESLASSTPRPQPDEDLARNEGSLQVEKVKSEVTILREEISSLLDEVETLELGMQTGSDESGEARTLSVVQDLRNKCVRYSQDLMKDLLVLDGVECPNDKAKALRKEQVSLVQQMLGNLDNLGDKLKTMSTTLERTTAPKDSRQRRRNRRRKHNQGSDPSPNASTSDSDTNSLGSMAKVHAETATLQAAMIKSLLQLLEPHWKSLKLKPRFDSIEDPRTRSYALAANIPGMKLGDIKVEVDEKDILRIRGFRMPTEAEILAIVAQLVKQEKNRGFIDSQAMDVWENMKDKGDDVMKARVGDILRACSGRFGTFTASYSLPRDADSDAVSGAYEGGVLRVTIPRHAHRQQSYAPSIPEFGFPGSGRGNQHARGFPFGGSRNNFFGNPDFFW